MNLSSGIMLDGMTLNDDVTGKDLQSQCKQNYWLIGCDDKYLRASAPSAEFEAQRG